MKKNSKYKAILLGLLCASMYGGVYAQKFNLKYDRHGGEVANNVITTKSGDCLAVGNSELLDYLALLVAPTGDTLWSILNNNVLSLTNGENAHAAVEMDNSYWLIGHTSNVSTPPTVGSDTRITKITKTGQYISSVAYDAGKGKTDRANDAVRLSDTTVAILGFYIDSVFSPGNSTTSNVLLTIVDTNINVLHRYEYGGSRIEEMHGLAVGRDGEFLMCGNNNSYGPAAYNFYVVKADKNGKELWHNVYGSGDRGYGLDILATHDGNYVAVGGSYYTKTPPQPDGYVVKTDTAGKVLWQRWYGTDKTADELVAVQQLPTGDLLVSGSSQRFTGDPNRNRFLGWAMKLNQSNGDVIWERFYRYNTNDSTDHYIYGADKTANNGLVMAGQILDWSSKDTSENDIWVVRVDSNGCYNDNCIITYDAAELPQPPSAEDAVLYPNPVSGGMLHIKNGSWVENADFYNLLGEKVIETTTQNIDVSSLQRGMYIVKLHGKGSTAVRKVLIE